ncbi:long-chain fatty acid--CoA ligase [Gordonia sp. CPCC 206044]|uniref:long-chain-fatty-acid--CoA ligase n=1 Tax=Gordonia sp. CPCC 206044 TaxID=3140793 RepID=UPI003AF3E0A0
MLNLAVMLEDSARRHPDRVAVVCGDERITYTELDVRAALVAGMLTARGIRPGDAVALSCPNIAEFVAIYFGILKAGAVVVPLNILLKPREIAYHLDDSGAKVYLCFEGTSALPMGADGWDGRTSSTGRPDMVVITADPNAPSPIPGTMTLTQAITEHRDVPHDTVSRAPDDTAVILYTSGTTGKPKGAELTHANMVLNALTANRQFDNDPSRPDTFLVTLPLFHSFGQTVMMNSGLSVGATLVLVPRFAAADALDLMLVENVTVFAGVPTMYWALLAELDIPGTVDAVDVARIAATMRCAISGGSALPADILERFEQRMGILIREGYGLSETSPLALFGDPERPPRPGSVGVPVWGVQARLIDSEGRIVEGPSEIGELVLRGHNVMKGYLGRPDATAATMTEGGWFRTGDLARRDHDGFYYIVDRSKDLIVRGGFNVYPREIEEVLSSHPAVSLAAVVSVHDERHGEEVAAVVVCADGAHVTEDELIDWCRGQMAAYKYPRSIAFTTELPMTATGKILKRELKVPSRAGTAG